MLHDHGDKLRVSWWKVAAPVPLRHTDPPELIAGTLNSLVSELESSEVGLKYEIALLLSN